MKPELTPLDVEGMPEIARLADEVARTRRPRLLRQNGEGVAILAPVLRPRKRRVKKPLSQEDLQAFLASAGSWNGLVDTDKLIADIYADRRASNRPPVEL